MATESVAAAKTPFKLAEDLQCELEKARAIFELVSEEIVVDARVQAALYGAIKLLKGCETDASALTQAIKTERSTLA